MNVNSNPKAYKTFKRHLAYGGVVRVSGFESDVFVTFDSYTGVEVTVTFSCADAQWIAAIITDIASAMSPDTDGS